MGLYPPSAVSPAISDADPGLELAISSLPFNVRGASEIGKKLGSSPLPYDFTAIPVFNVETTNFQSLTEKSCPYITKRYYELFNDANAYKDYQHLIEQVRWPIGVALGLPDEVTAAADILML